METKRKNSPRCMHHLEFDEGTHDTSKTLSNLATQDINVVKPPTICRLGKLNALACSKPFKRAKISTLMAKSSPGDFEKPLTTIPLWSLITLPSQLT